MLIASLFAENKLALCKSDFSKPKWELFRLNGKFKTDSESSFCYDHQYKDDAWKAYSSYTSCSAAKGLFDPHQEEMAIAAHKAILRFEEEKEQFEVRYKEAINGCISGIVEPAAIEDYAQYTRAVVLHMSQTHDGLTGSFLEETRPALERLLVMSKLATEV